MSTAPTAPRVVASLVRSRMNRGAPRKRRAFIFSEYQPHALAKPRPLWKSVELSQASNQSAARLIRVVNGMGDSWLTAVLWGRSGRLTCLVYDRLIPLRQRLSVARLI